MNNAPSTAVDRQLGAFANVDGTDAQDFIERLDNMHAADGFRAYKRDTFARLRLASGMRIADVGCGAGDDANTLAKIVGTSGHVTGFDMSAGMVAEAAARHTGCAQLSFAQATADKLGLPDNSLDAIRADRVFVHIPDPDAAIAEMLRVLKPGGRIVISEPDMPGFWVASDDYVTTAIIVGAVARSCVNPFIPRDLWNKFSDLGLTDVEFQCQMYPSFDLQMVNKVLDFNAVVQMLTAKNILTAPQAETWLGDQLARGQNGRFVAGLCIMVTSATKP